MLLGYAYPGNVRELKNIIERAVILTESFPHRAQTSAAAGSQPREQGSLPPTRPLEVVQAWIPSSMWKCA